MNTASCTLVVVGYDGERWLEGCLKSLRESTSRPLRLVLLDNGGNGSLNRLPLSDFETIVLAAPRRMGFAEANNYSLVTAGIPTDAVCFLNQDTQSEPGWLDECLELLSLTPKLAAVSPLLFRFDGTQWDEGFLTSARHVPEFDEQAGRAQPARLMTGPEVPAAALVVRSDVLGQVGPFDPIYGSYYEDFDLCWRIQQAGFAVGIASRSVVRHFGGSSTTTPERERLRMRQVLRNRTIYRIRRSGPGRARAIIRQVAVDIPRNLARGLVGTPSSQPLGVQMQALRDLASIAPRLLSGACDRNSWQLYLNELGWGAVASPGSRTASGFSSGSPSAGAP